jgi:hypothetical protein
MASDSAKSRALELLRREQAKQAKMVRAVVLYGSKITRSSARRAAQRRPPGRPAAGACRERHPPRPCRRSC